MKQELNAEARKVKADRMTAKNALLVDMMAAGQGRDGRCCVEEVKKETPEVLESWEVWLMKCGGTVNLWCKIELLSSHSEDNAIYNCKRNLSPFLIMKKRRLN